METQPDPNLPGSHCWETKAEYQRYVSCDWKHHQAQGPRVTLYPATLLASTILNPACEWTMVVDLDKRLKFPLEVTPTTLRPDWEVCCHHLWPHRPWDYSVCKANKAKHLRYVELVSNVRQISWKVQILSVDVKEDLRLHVLILRHCTTNPNPGISASH